jgi:hypothetical protein
VVQLGGSSLLGLIGDLATSEVFLHIFILVKDDTKTGGKVDDVTLRIVVNILFSVLATVTVNVLELISHFRWRAIFFGMIFRLDSGSSFPGSDRKELLSFTDFISLEFEKFSIIIWACIICSIDVNITMSSSSCTRTFKCKILRGSSPIFCGLNGAITG